MNSVAVTYGTISTNIIIGLSEAKWKETCTVKYLRQMANISQVFGRRT